MTDQVSLAILDSNEDAALIKNPFCERCATKKLNALFFCKISNKDAQDLVKMYKMDRDDAIEYMFPSCEEEKKAKKKKREEEERDRRRGGKKNEKNEEPVQQIKKINLFEVKCECGK